MKTTENSLIGTNTYAASVDAQGPLGHNIDQFKKGYCILLLDDYPRYREINDIKARNTSV